MVVVYDLSQEVYALVHREYTFIRLYGKPDLCDLEVDGITNLPQFRFRVTEYHAVIAIAVEMADAVLVLQIMV